MYLSDEAIDAIAEKITQANKHKACWIAVVKSGPNAGKFVSYRFNLVGRRSALRMCTDDMNVWAKSLPTWLEPLDNWELVQVRKAKKA
jgi:hypothetical protein